VIKNILSGFPSPEKLEQTMNSKAFPAYREANGHIHTPFSFSAFNEMDTLFAMAEKEGIKALGINDFYVTDGYESFYNECLASNIFPLFNIEFIGLMQEKQKEGIRINDPNNPGRIYICGKGLDYPFNLDDKYRTRLNILKEETQNQLREMVSKLNILISKINPSIVLSFDDIKSEYARDLVRERHLARALRRIAEKNFATPDDQIGFIESVYGGRQSKAGMNNTAALENEIRATLLKAGGEAFVEEDERSFISLDDAMKIITGAGGIPCYPVLLDDTAGKRTKFEDNFTMLCSSLTGLGIGCVELIPGRNDLQILKEFVRLFDERGFIITFGTEHNTPEMIPLTVSARGKEPLDDWLRQISWKGICAIAAHQYFRAQKQAGYIDEKGHPRTGNKKYFEKVGQLEIEYYLSKPNHETGNL
jgi:hypothetical protein